jgi:hypothetical protein
MVKKAKASAQSSKPSGQTPTTVVDVLIDGFVRLLQAEQGKKPDPPEAYFEDERLTRADVLDLAHQGSWTAERAEAWAERRGFAPFTEKPDRASYDPREELNWTLPMSVIWIATRDIDKVREAWPEWLNAHKVWGSFELGGKTCWRLGPLGRDEDAALRQYHDDAPRPVKALWSALQTGTIVATGISTREGLRRAIRQEEWLDLTSGNYPAAFLDKVFTDTNERLSEAFTKLLLPADQVLRVFPAKAGGTEHGPFSSPSLVAVLHESLRENPALTQAAAEIIARARGITDSREAIRDKLKSLGGSDKPGPKGPRKKRAVPTA